MDWLTWQQCSHLYEMLSFLGDRLSDRKRRLFAVSCCRAGAHLLADSRSRAALDVAERFACGQASEEERQAAEDAAYLAYIELGEQPLVSETGQFLWNHQVESLARAAALAASHGVYYALDAADACRSGILGDSLNRYSLEREEEARQCEILREIVGPAPFFPLRADPLWLALDGGAVLQLARFIDEEQAFDQMFVLGDALEEAGCNDSAVLDHCRGLYRHVRGCWLVDLLLGRG